MTGDLESRGAEPGRQVFFLEIDADERSRYTEDRLRDSGLDQYVCLGGGLRAVTWARVPDRMRWPPWVRW